MKVKHWLDEIIEEQKHNTDIMESICSPLSPAELVELADHDFDPFYGYT